MAITGGDDPGGAGTTPFSNTYSNEPEEAAESPYFYLGTGKYNPALPEYDKNSNGIDDIVEADYLSQQWNVVTPEQRENLSIETTLISISLIPGVSVSHESQTFYGNRMVIIPSNNKYKTNVSGSYDGIMYTAFSPLDYFQAYDYNGDTFIDFYKQ